MYGPSWHFLSEKKAQYARQCAPVLWLSTFSGKRASTLKYIFEESGEMQGQQYFLYRRANHKIIIKDISTLALTIHDDPSTGTMVCTNAAGNEVLKFKSDFTMRLAELTERARKTFMKQRKITPNTTIKFMRGDKLLKIGNTIVKQAPSMHTNHTYTIPR